jgi:hypothetical protein
MEMEQMFACLLAIMKANWKQILTKMDNKKEMEANQAKTDTIQ